MKNVYRVTRPAWSRLDKTETPVILFASILLGIYGGWGERIGGRFVTWLGVPKETVHDIWPLIDVIVVTTCCLLLIRFYKKIRVGCYPCTFIYCFKIPEASNPSGKNTVVGYGNLQADSDTGEIKSKGASFFWENNALGKRTRFTSTVVRATQIENKPTCHIEFTIDVEDQKERYYRHGVLLFRLSEKIEKREKDSYAGYLKSKRDEAELQDVEVRGRGYAETHVKKCLSEEEIRPILTTLGNRLVTRLEEMERTMPLSSLWIENAIKPYIKINQWDHRIPTPQSAMLDDVLLPHITRYLSKVLALFGLTDDAVQRFVNCAGQIANKEDDTLAYERELKRQLTGQKKAAKEDEALTHRAKIIYDEIKEYLVGDSLLDIGCGNGKISNLARHKFKRIQLIDVVRYVPAALNLQFLEYKEGNPLPTDEKFDTVLLLTVLHHSMEPLELLKQAWQATRRRLIIIESVVGIHQVKPSVRYDLANLSDQNQIAFAAFVDWFYNRVLHDDVPVPYNFTTVENWQSIFLQYKMNLIKTVDFGQDIEIGPEYHVLFVLEKDNAAPTI